MIEIILYIILFLLTVLAGYAAGHFEVERLKVERWKNVEFSDRIKFWETDQTNWFKKNFDSFHWFQTLEQYANWTTMFVLVVKTMLYGGEILAIFLQVLIISELYWYVRNIEMLIVALKKPRWIYLIPRLGGYLEKKYGR